MIELNKSEEHIIFPSKNVDTNSNQPDYSNRKDSSGRVVEKDIIALKNENKEIKENNMKLIEKLKVLEKKLNIVKMFPSENVLLIICLITL
jgi:hypothetical protein